MQPIKMDWQKFIENGYGSISEARKAQKDLTKNIEYVPKDGNLFVTAQMRGNVRHYVVVCRCGNSRMTVHENGIRCQPCARFHTLESFAKAKAEARRQASFTDSKILKIPQPFQIMAELEKAKKINLFRSLNKKLPGSSSRK